MDSPGRKRLRYGECVPLPGDLTYVPISKNASSTILTAVWEQYPDAPRDVWYDDIPTKNAVVMWRDPTLRLWSAYQWLRRPSRGEPDAQAALPWEEWVSTLVLTPDLSASLQPQTSWIVAGPNYIFVAWDFPEIERLLGVKLGHKNKRQVNADVPSLSADTKSHLYALYEKDYDLWALIRPHSGTSEHKNRRTKIGTPTKS